MNWRPYPQDLSADLYLPGKSQINRLHQYSSAEVRLDLTSLILLRAQVSPGQQQ